MILNAQKSYFAATNSGLGFKSYFSEIFENAKKQYIIKGGPGTGKSYLMKKAADEAEKRGYDVEYFYCSSDPDSLDGIFIHGLDVAVADGTSPHAIEASYPGVRDSLLDIGRFWDEKKLAIYADEIKKLINRRSYLWKGVYRYLDAALKLSQEYDSYVSDAVISEKLNAAIRRLTKNFSSDGDGKTHTRILSAISMKGPFTFDTFRAISKNSYVINDRFGIAAHIYQYLLNEIKSRGISAHISYDPLTGKCDGIYLPNDSICIITASKEFVYGENDHEINAARFVNKEVFASRRAKLRFILRCREEIMNGAYDTLNEIRELHFRLEEIYTKAMNFKAKEKFTEGFLKTLFE